MTGDLKSRKSTAIRKGMITSLADRYRCPDEFVQFDVTGKLSFDWDTFGLGTMPFVMAGRHRVIVLTMLGLYSMARSET